MRRLLLPGDVEVLRKIDTTVSSGAEIELPRKLRLLAHGLALEVLATDGVAHLTPHPLIRAAL
ncbi:MAG: hypothetical protein H0V89_14795 [Deltaproteobacteria bacterium]|nr:hypothetical protein [Deltaproteobacteria bacterium]